VLSLFDANRAIPDLRDDLAAVAATLATGAYRS
jgi:hypothetical protein